MINSILISGEYVLLGGEMAEKSELAIEWVDYNDDYFDIQIVHKNNNELFGSMALCGIPSLERTKQRINEISKKTGITEIIEYKHNRRNV